MSISSLSPSLNERVRFGDSKGGLLVVNSLISKTKDYLNKFLEVGVLLLAVSVIAEILFGPDVPFFGSKVTSNLIELLNNLGDQGIAALIIIFALIVVYRKLLK